MPIGHSTASLLRCKADRTDCGLGEGWAHGGQCTSGGSSQPQGNLGMGGWGAPQSRCPQASRTWGLPAPRSLFNLNGRCGELGEGATGASQLRRRRPAWQMVPTTQPTSASACRRSARMDVAGGLLHVGPSSLLWALAMPGLSPPGHLPPCCEGMAPLGYGLGEAGTPGLHERLTRMTLQRPAVTTQLLPQKAILFVQTPGHFPGAPASRGHQAPGSHRQARCPQGGPGGAFSTLWDRPGRPPAQNSWARRKRVPHGPPLRPPHPEAIQSEHVPLSSGAT